MLVYVQKDSNLPSVLVLNAVAIFQDLVLSSEINWKTKISFWIIEDSHEKRARNEELTVELFPNGLL